LATLNEYTYTTGSIALSNFIKVFEVEGKVVALLFAYNENMPVPKHDFQKISSKLKIVKELFVIKNMPFKEKIKILKSMAVHESNKAKLIKHGSSEIFLFVTDPSCQGKGYGKQLLSAFFEYCKNAGVQAVQIETNRLGASTFYEKVGCQLKGDFDSPLHEYTTKGGQACAYEYIL